VEVEFRVVLMRAVVWEWGGLVGVLSLRTLLLLPLPLLHWLP
jgi:hypothetical protein